MTTVKPASVRKTSARLLTDQRGALSTEYLIVTAIGLFVAAGLGVIGVAMVDGYGASLQNLYSDSP